jgi:hypothetical protein
MAREVSEGGVVDREANATDWRDMPRLDRMATFGIGRNLRKTERSGRNICRGNPFVRAHGGFAPGQVQHVHAP